jgi:hypothetical protein
MITLTSASASPVTIELGDRLLWTDEYEWSAAETETAYSTTGALLIDCAQKSAGRTITLDGQAGAAWMRRSTVDQLHSLKSTPGAVFTLTIRGVARSVVWLEFDAVPVWMLLDSVHTGETVYRPNFKFIEV